jgi:hypothetical protein
VGALVARVTVDTDQTPPVNSNEVQIDVTDPNCTANPPDSNFGDVPDTAWYGEGLDWAACHGLVSGFPNGTYGPRDPVNRAQVVAMLWNLVGRPTGAPAHGFPDVPAGAWYGDALSWAKAEGIVSGYPNGTYRPKDPVRRGQIASMLWNLVNRPPGSPDHGFADVPATAAYNDGLDWAKAMGIVSGFPDNLYKPQDAVNRAQIANMLYLLAGNETAWSAWEGDPLATWRFDPND